MEVKRQHKCEEAYENQREMKLAATLMVGDVILQVLFNMLLVTLTLKRRCLVAVALQRGIKRNLAVRKQMRKRLVQGVELIASLYLIFFYGPTKTSSTFWQ